MWLLWSLLYSSAAMNLQVNAIQFPVITCLSLCRMGPLSSLKFMTRSSWCPRKKKCFSATIFQLVSQEEVLQCRHIPAGVPRRRSAPVPPHSSWCPKKKKCSSAATFQLVSQEEEVLQCRHIPAGVPRRRSAPVPPHSSWCPKKKCSSAAPLS